jgi:hypothetical protein
MKKRQEDEDLVVLSDKNADRSETLLGFIYEQADRFYVNHIPFDSVKDMSSTCK